MPRGNWTPKQERMYSSILSSCKRRKKTCRTTKGGRTVCERTTKKVCQRVAAATVNKFRSKSKARRRRSRSGSRRRTSGLSCGCGA